MSTAVEPAARRDPNSIGVVLAAVVTAHLVEHVVRPARRVWRATAFARGFLVSPQRSVVTSEERTVQ